MHGRFERRWDVGIDDILALDAVWGDCDGICPEDLNGDRVVIVNDLLISNQAWGTCK